MIFIILLASLIGVLLGLLGGGGSILAVPVLTYGAGLAAKEAIATSLLVVGGTSLFALIPHARRGHVEWKTGIIFAITAMIGAYLGGLSADYFSGKTLLLLFAGMMIVTALAMLHERNETVIDSKESLPILLVSGEGLIVGAVTGLIGAGGGFLVVPALVLLSGMEMHKAIGTSLMVIALKSFAAFAGHAAHVSIDLQLALIFTGSAIVGSLFGVILSHSIPAKTLRKFFAVFVLSMAGYMIWREIEIIALKGLFFGAICVLGIGLIIFYWKNKRLLSMT